MCLFGHQRGYGEMQFPIKSARKEKWNLDYRAKLALGFEKVLIYIIWGYFLIKWPNKFKKNLKWWKLNRREIEDKNAPLQWMRWGILIYGNMYIGVMLKIKNHFWRIIYAIDKPTFGVKFFWSIFGIFIWGSENSC